MKYKLHIFSIIFLLLVGIIISIYYIPRFDTEFSFKDNINLSEINTNFSQSNEKNRVLFEANAVIGNAMIENVGFSSTGYNISTADLIACIDTLSNNTYSKGDNYIYVGDAHITANYISNLAPGDSSSIKVYIYFSGNVPDSKGFGSYLKSIKIYKRIKKAKSSPFKGISLNDLFSNSFDCNLMDLSNSRLLKTIKINK